MFRPNEQVTKAREQEKRPKELRLFETCGNRNKNMEPVTRLGKHETTVLTNRSNFITIVSDLPFKQRRNSDAQHFSKAFTQTGTYQKGSRPFHQTTLCFEDKPQKIEYLTTTHQVKYNEC